MKTKNIVNYNQPKYVYLPYTTFSNEKNNVLVGEFVCIFNNKRIYSPISGTIKNFKTVLYNNKEVKALEIENDYKDSKKELIKIKNDFNCNDEEFKKLIKSNGYEKINMKEIALNINYKSNYEESDSLEIKEYVNDILYMLDKISEIYKSNLVSIILDKKDKESKMYLYDFLGTYPNIKIIRKVNKNVSIYTLNEFINLLYLIKYNSVNTNIYVTICYKNTIYIVKTKRYITIGELLEFLNIKYKKLFNIKKEKLNENTILDDKIKTIIIR